MHLFRKALGSRINPLFEPCDVPQQLRTFAEFMNDLYFIFTDYARITEQVDTIVASANLLHSHGVQRSLRYNRSVVRGLASFLIAKDRGLGFAPSLTNSAVGVLLMYSLLKATGLCPRLLRNRHPLYLDDHASPHFCVEVALNPQLPRQTIIVDPQLFIFDKNITADSLLDYYDQTVTMDADPVNPIDVGRALPHASQQG